MHCTKCGTSASTNAKFCAECGSPIGEPFAENSVGVSPVATRKPIAFYVAGILLAFAYAFLFAQATAGQHVSPQVGYGYIFWTGVLFYYWWKQSARKGWRGAVLGSVLALLALFIAAFIVGVVGHGA